jgi:hypothetical protein
LVAFYLIAQALKYRLFPFSPFVAAFAVLGVLALFLAVAIGHGHPFVAVYGVRPFVLHIPVLFITARLLERDDIIQIGRLLLIVSCGMTLLIAVQFYSPQSSWVNVGVGGEGSSGFSGALGYFRPSGTFSFTNGLAMFYAIVASYIFYFWLNPQNVNRLLLIVATTGLLIALPLSISRTLVFQVIVTLCFASMALTTNGRFFIRGIAAISALIITGLVLTKLGVFEESVAAITTRFTIANVHEGGISGTLVERYLGGLLAIFLRYDEWPLFGLGAGMGTNVGAMLLSGDVGFLIAEGEWQRLGGELGIFLATAVVGLRVWLTAFTTVHAFRALRRGDLLPWILLANVVTSFPQGEWGQPTALGFSIVGMALLLASLKDCRG